MIHRIAGRIAVGIVILIACLCLAGLGTARGGMQVGAAAVKITPQKLLWQNGYGSRNHPAEGTAMDLWARAIALRDASGKRSVIVSLEVLGIPPAMNESIRSKARAQFGLRDAELMLVATHTHAGPALPERPSLEIFLAPGEEETRLIHEYAAWLEQRLLEAIDQAMSRCEPARLEFGHGRATFAMNRRVITASGVSMAENPGGAVDHDVPVLTALRPDGSVNAILYGYACHCTTIGGDYYHYHGDYAGVASEELQKRYPGAVPVFVTGCGADANPSPRGKVEMTVPHGQELAQAVSRVVDGKATREITAWPRQTYQRIELGFEKPPTREQWEQLTTDKNVFVTRHAKFHLQLLDQNRLPLSMSYPVQTWQFGKELTLVALGGEVVADYASRLKKQYGAEGTWVVAYANEVACYIPSKRVLEEGGYEAGWSAARGRTTADGSMLYYGWPAPLTTGTEERICSALHRALEKEHPETRFATASQLKEFLGDPVFVPMQPLWKGRGGWGGILSTPDGTVVAFQSPGGGSCRRSRDGGLTWDAEIQIGPDAKGGRALVDETKGDLLYVNPGAGWLFRSRDQGASWVRESVQVKPDGFGFIPRTEGVTAMQCGITLAFGAHRGRLIMPARIMGPKSSNAVEWRPYHYSTALYSDDGGAVWQTSKPFPVLGTGEAALAELSDGSILYNSREHMSRGNRYFAWSHDGGDLWLGAMQSPDLPDGSRGTSYGCMGGMIRLPVGGQDILLYSNLDTDAGQMPRQVGASTDKGREKITVWASFDGGRSWPVKRLVYDGPSAYSSLGVGRKGTPSQGKIYLLFEGGPTSHYEAVQVASFNLSWLLNGRDIAGFLPR